MEVSDEVYAVSYTEGYDYGFADGKRSLQNPIIKWAHDRNLIHGSTAQAQMVKLMEEAGELAGGIAKDKPEVIADSIGDCAVVLIILAEQCGLDFSDCVAQAYDEIKDRRGKMQDGFFVKEGD